MKTADSIDNDPFAVQEERPHHFAYTLAKFSVYAPLFVVIIGFISNNALREPANSPVTQPSGTLEAAKMLAYLNLSLLGASVVSGLIALCFTPWLGASKILARSLTGILISATFLAAVGYIFWMPSDASKMQQRIAGDWYTTLPILGQGDAHVKMSLSTDGTAHWDVLDGPKKMTLAGRWHVSAPAKLSTQLSLHINLDAPPANIPTMTGMGWNIDHATNTQLDLSTVDAKGKPSTEIYTRKP